MGLLAIVGSTILSAILTFWFIPQILIVSFRKKLFDLVDARKVHTGVVPRLGGVAFVPSILISLSFVVGAMNFLPSESVAVGGCPIHVSFCLCALILLYFEGIMDDLVGLRYKTKFMMQIICAVLIVASGVSLNDFYGLFGVNEIPAYIGNPLSVLVIVFLINAINLIDGIDGLASGLSIVSSFFFGLIFYYLGLVSEALVSFTLFGTLLPFFYYNVFGDAQKRRKIFMGDTGSQCVGLILAVLAVRLSMNVPQVHDKLQGSVIIAFSMLLVPAFDVIRVMLHRYRRHKNMFEPDKSHIHHKLLLLGMSHRSAMVSILLVAVFFVALNVGLLISDLIDINLILLLDVSVWTVAHLILTKAIHKTHQEGNEKY